MKQYTIQETTPEVYELISTTDAERMTVGSEHPKWYIVNKAATTSEPRLIKINASGRWTSLKDYHGAYNETGSNNSTPAAPVEVKLQKLDDLHIDDSLFVPMLTNTIADKFLSTEGGFLPGTNINMAGSPGVGKTSLAIDLLSQVHQAGKRTLFISAEMTQLDMLRYLKRFPHWGQIPMLFLGDYIDSDPKAVIENTLAQGWDLVLTDSFTEVNDTVKEANNMSRGKCEKWFLDLMTKHNMADNETRKHTTFITILQLSKGGTFVGSNKLSHMASAMMYVKWDGNENSNRRYMEFVKNRVGQVNKKLYFSLEAGVTFDAARWTRDLLNDELVAEERKQLETEGDAFDRLFGFDQDGVPEELKTEMNANIED